MFLFSGLTKALSGALLDLFKKRDQFSFPLGKPSVSSSAVSSWGARPKPFPLYSPRSPGSYSYSMSSICV